MNKKFDDSNIFSGGKDLTSCIYDDNNFLRRNKYNYKKIILYILVIGLIFYLLILFNNYYQSKYNVDDYKNEKRYSLEFSSEKVRPLSGESKAYGYGFIQLSNSSMNPYVCWSFSAIGLITYIDKLNIHGPLIGTGENSITSDIFISLNSKYNNDRYNSCITNEDGLTSEFINKIYNDPSKFYLLASTTSKPDGAIWSNFGGQWDIIDIK
jgi:hypothetical protein